MAAIKLTPVLKNYIWGGDKMKTMFGRSGEGNIAESWEISVHPDGVSETENDTLAEYLKMNPYAVDESGKPFPILIKYIDAKSNLSVQVHPDDTFARRYENDNGKTEMWYILQADDGAGIYCGFKTDIAKTDFIRGFKKGTIEQLLNFIPVHEGDCFLIKAGTVHAIGAGCVICEVQQSSNVTYRVYDYNRLGIDGNPRPLHIDKAMEVINFKEYKDETNCGEWKAVRGGKMRLLTQCEYFRCRELCLNGVYEETAKKNIFEGFAVYGEAEKLTGKHSSKEIVFLSLAVNFLILKAKQIL